MNVKRLLGLTQIQGRRLNVLIAILLLLWSGWASAACCCNTPDVAANAVEQAMGASSEELHASHSHDHESVPTSHDDSPASDCDHATAPHHAMVTKDLAPSVQASLEHLVLFAASFIVAVQGLPGDRLAKWTLPPPPSAPPQNPFLESVRLLL